MVLGNQKLRYLFLSTCESVKIGSGENPIVAGESPEKTWNSEIIKGLRCIYGYSSSSVDSGDYGSFFWKQLTSSTDVSLTQAFFNASWEISSTQIPAVLCFGADAKEATANIDAKSFIPEKANNAYAVWRWQDTKQIITETSSILLEAEMNADSNTHYLTMQLASMSDDAPNELLLRKRKAMVIHDELQNLRQKQIVQLQTKDIASVSLFSDQEAIGIALQFLKNNLILPTEKEYQLFGVKTTYQASSDDKTPNVLVKEVILKQLLSGLRIDDNSAEMRVSINNGNKKVSGIYDGFLPISSNPTTYDCRIW
jgi:hypothetical protein